MKSSDLLGIAKSVAKNIDTEKLKEKALSTIDIGKEKAIQVHESVKNIDKEKIKDNTSMAVNAGKEKLSAAQQKVVSQLDANGDGSIGIDDIIILAIKTPGVHIDRAEFLKNQFSKNHTEEIVNKIIDSTPAKAGISAEEINKIANNVINHERIYVSGISAALSAPGGVAMAATIPADITQYYGYTLRAVQKLLYLYGFPAIELNNESASLDDGTLNEIILCMGVMYGAVNANNAIKAVANALAKGVEKKLLRAALTKGTVYPFIKSLMKWFGVSLTKKAFASVVSKSIPVVGGVIGGGLTFATFAPCCRKLMNSLKDTGLSNLDHVASKEESEILHGIITGETIEGVFTDVIETEEFTEAELVDPSESVEQAEYDSMDLNHDGVVDEKDMEIFKQRIEENK